MKYLRKAVLLIIVVVLLASVVIGAGVVLSVRNVNVTLISSSFDADSEEAYAEIAEYKEKFSRKVKVSAANSVYSALSPEKRLCGTIFCSLSEGAASAVYHV